MKKVSALLLAIGVTAFAVPVSSAAVLSSIPGPDDQGALQGDGSIGMIMPMVSLSGNTISAMFMPAYAPLMAGLDFWEPGDTFESTSAWYSLLDPVGGEGALFNNQYGFMLMGAQPSEGSLAIRMTAVSSPLLQSWNYLNSANRFDEVFQDVGSQVLWSGGMWHNYFTLPADAAPGTYSATFEIFVANEAFTSGTGFADYSAAAQNATRNTNYNTVTFTYEWTVVPEPSTILLSMAGLVVLAARHRFCRN